MIAFIVQVPVMTVAFRYGDSPKSRFYGFPVARVGILYPLAQLVLNFLFMLLSSLIPVWVGVLIYVILFAAAAVGFIATDAIRENIEQQDEKLKIDVATMRKLQSDALVLTAKCKDANAQPALKKLAEALRFSDPVSKPALAEIEEKLVSCMVELQKAVSDENQEAVAAICAKFDEILIERNQLCKLTK